MTPWSSLLGRHRLRAPAPSIVIALSLLLLVLSWTCRATQRVVRGNITGWAVVLTVTSARARSDRLLYQCNALGRRVTGAGRVTWKGVDAMRPRFAIDAVNPSYRHQAALSS